MDLRGEILDYELCARIGMNDIHLEVGSSIPVRREHIAKDPNAAANRIVACEIICIEKHVITGKVALQIQADGYVRTPFISIDQIENSWEDHPPLTSFDITRVDRNLREPEAINDNR